MVNFGKNAADSIIFLSHMKTGPGDSNYFESLNHKNGLIFLEDIELAVFQEQWSRSS